ncbi:hypothetical protein PRZ48_014923 [Zasmidium cellare]|uniref:Protein kinase domain-containing protein n=1 Tax=Zasmidium cellare TaxID=395010 RepID=A0ABR0DXS4_ZASCE|nr:hypothetical protein PRZ48_014923 [Zasmidium cellare]
MATNYDLPHWHPRYRAGWQRQYHCLPRWARLMAITTVSLFGILGLIHGLRDIHDNSLKQQRTDFGSLRDPSAIWPPSQPMRIVTREHHIDDRYHYVRHLGQGAEGSTSLYVDLSTSEKVVVKTFKNVARNELPPSLLVSDIGNYTATWPTEIEAGLLLGGASAEGSFVRVLDYFVLQSEDHWSWALVTPFVSGGTLGNLAARERRREKISPEQWDELYRPVFNNLLSALTSLHETGLCHDDIKPNNILVESNDHWLIGDLGGVRHKTHSWHSTVTWQHQNQWPDCKSNDVRRALKSYLWFLREASADNLDFDRQFWERNSSWSKMYWNYVRHPYVVRITAVQNGVETSEVTTGLQDRHLEPDTAMLRESNAELGRATLAELTCTTVPRRLWKHWWWWFWMA